MSRADIFLETAFSNWPRLPEALLEDCTEEEKKTVRGLEQISIEGQMGQLADMVRNCTNKFQFAKTYKVLRKSMKQYLERWKQPPHLTPPMNQAMRTFYERMARANLHYLGEWFTMTMASEHDLNSFRRTGITPIDQYAGQENAKGCLGVAAFFVAMLLGFWFLVALN